MLAALSPLMIQRCYAGLQVRGLSARIVRYSHAVLNRSLKQAVKWQMLPRNPAESVDLPRLEKREMEFLTPAQAAEFVKAIEDHPHRAVFVLALFTGMRPSEYLALKWSDIDFEKSDITVQRTLIRVKSKWMLSEPKTRKSRRSVPISPFVVNALKRHKVQQAELKLKIGAAWQETGFVFTTKVGTWTDRINFHRRVFVPLLKQYRSQQLRAQKLSDEGASIGEIAETLDIDTATVGRWLKTENTLPEKLRLYDLRHSAATLLLKTEANPKVVAERLGHSSLTTTMDTYSHVLPDMQRDVIERMEEAVGIQRER